MAKKKILIAMTDAGNAHRIAAEAIEYTFNKLYPDQYEVKIIDILKEADVEPFNTSDTSYSLVSKNTFLDNFNIFISKILNKSIPFDFFKSYTINMMYEAVKEIVDGFKPDLVICNHPVPAMVLGELRKNASSFKYVVTILDLVTFFRSLADQNADLIFAPTTEIVSSIVRFGVELEKIVYPLFPLHPKLKEAKTKKEIAQDLSFDISKPIVLITGGGLGTRTLRDAIMRLCKRSDLQLIIVTGRLSYFKKELEDRFKGNKNIKIFGFVDNMQDFFRACDIVVAKPGATTIMECELFEKKVIFTKRVGHVEVGHDKYVQRNPKFRYIGNDWSKLEETVDDLLESEYNEVKNPNKRSFDECERMVEEMVKLIN